MSTNLDYFSSVIRGQRQGVGPTLLRWALRLASAPYGLVTRARNFCFDRGWKKSIAVPVPVVSVGNLTVGGTGKTPCVEYIARFYRDRDVRVAILSRGYGADQGANDEALVLQERLPDVPHLQGPDRAALASIAIEELESELLLLDDGFQHRRLARDLDVVLIDCTDPWGQGYLLPRGFLRESPRGLKRAGVIVLTRCDQIEAEPREKICQRIARIAPDVPVVETRHRAVELINSEGESQPLELLQDHPIAAFCGIGNPEAFRRTLSDLGASIVDFKTFNDHHRYTREDVDNLRSWAGSLPAGAMVITTHKDLVKLCIPALQEKPLWALRICLEGMTEDSMTPLENKLGGVIKIFD